MNEQIKTYLSRIQLPPPDSHKGQNGKLLVIGGSDFFHAAGKWSLDVASKFVDMVFYSSVPSNNQLVQTAKTEFWNGIVIEHSEVPDYIQEADCILIGPGMIRSSETEQTTNDLLKQYPQKKWVVDAGALQMVDPTLLNQKCLITPHGQELARLTQKRSQLQLLEQGVTILLKGQTDQVLFNQEVIEVMGGNAGMTKGGTGDVLAGLAAALYCRHDVVTSAVVASYVNKQAGQSLYQEVGPFYNTSDLVAAVPRVFWQILTDLQQ